MSESVIADFRAEAIYADTYRMDPEPCRVILSQKRLVVVSDEQRRQIPLGDVFEVIVSKIPPDLSEFFSQTVLVGYISNQNRRTVLIKGDHERIDQFAMFLYKATLQGRTATVKHPARVGGRLTDEQYRDAEIQLYEDSVRFSGQNIDFTINLSAIVDISYIDREIEGDSQPVLSVQHMSDSQSVTTEISHTSVRKLNILARYLRLRYFQLENELERIDVDNQETEVLIALYSGGKLDQLQELLDINDQQVEELLAQMEEKGLLSGTDNPKLTSWGQLIVADRIDDINI